MAHRTPPLYPAVDKCSSGRRETHTAVADLDGALINSRSSFPYFALLAFDSGGVLRLLFLLLLSPLAAVLRRCISESAGIRVLIFASLAGVKLSSIESAARAVLPKFYVEDLREDTWRVFAGCGRRVVVTGSPRVMVEVFLREYLGAHEVVGTELGSFMGRATGFVSGPGVLVGEKKAVAVKKLVGNEVPEIGVGGWEGGLEFLRHCKEAYVAPPKTEIKSQRSNSLPKPVFFHDGRLVQKPTPLIAFTLILWFPFAVLLAGLRIAAGALLPMKYAYFAFWFLGVRLIVNGAPPPPAPTDESGGRSGMLFVCSHRTLLDPIFLSAALGRPVSAVTYSLSRLSEFLSPIRTVRLTRHRIKDAEIINSLLKKGDLVLCPEGTTSREPLLLRFSALFAELSDEMVPVGMASRISMFHGTAARGWKGLDSLYFFMNPTPVYEVTFLDKLPAEQTCGAGKSSHEVANYIQRAIAAKLGYECTSFTRKDKYMALAGNHGSIH